MKVFKPLLLGFLLGLLIHPLEAFSAPSTAIVPNKIYSQQLPAEQQFSCSGSFINDSGLLLTAAHCVPFGTFETNVRVTKPNGSQDFVKGYVVAKDEAHDLALVQVEGVVTPDYFTVGENIHQGERVILAGFPAPDTYGYNLKSFNGEVQGLYDENIVVIKNTFVYGGMSGGTAYNSSKELIGVTDVAIFQDEELYEKNKHSDTAGIVLLDNVRAFLIKNKALNTSPKNPQVNPEFATVLLITVTK